MRYRLHTLLIAFALAPPLVAYVGSYYVLSRRGYAYADTVGYPAYWFVPPESDKSGQLHARYRRFYWPLIRLEIFLGTGREPDYGSIRGLS